MHFNRIKHEMVRRSVEFAGSYLHTLRGARKNPKPEAGEPDLRQAWFPPSGSSQDRSPAGDREPREVLESSAGPPLASHPPVAANPEARWE